MPLDISRAHASLTDEREQSTAALRAAETDLHEAQLRSSAVGLFSRRVSHDLSNFLTVIRTYSELMMADVPLEHPNRGDLQEISDAAEATIAYIQRVSAAGRAGVSKPAPVVLDALVRDTVAGGLAATLEPLTVELACPKPVSASSSALSDALTELLRNAREASPEGGTIALHTRDLSLPSPRLVDAVAIPAGHWGVVEIRDQGAGLRTLDVAPLEPFTTTKTGIRGSGMGLPIARAAAWGAGGQLTLGRESDVTVARLWLPVVAPGESQP